MTNDPWASASAAATKATPTPASNTNTGVQSAGVAVDVANPFATQQEAAATVGGSGTWDPRVPFDVIEGRMIVMVPKSFREDAPVPAAFSPKEDDVREEYRVDLIVLDGERFSFEYNFRASKDAEVEKRTWEVREFPSLHRGQTVAQGGLIRALKGADKTGRFLYGVMTMVPQVRDLSLYPTPEALKAARDEWIAALGAGKRGLNEPRYTWGLDDRPHVLTPDRINLAVQWWETEKRRRLDAGE